MNTETEVRLVGGLAFLFVLYSLWMGQVKIQGLPGGYPNPVLALELVKNGADIDAINQAEGGKARAFIRASLFKDFGYILVYMLLFVFLSLLLSRMNFSWARGAGWIAATCAVVAAVLDLIENRGMLRAIAGEVSDSLASNIRYSSLAKWGFLFIFSLLVGLLLVSRRDLFAIPALFFLLAALLGLSGVIMNLLRPRFYWMFPAAIISLGIAVSVLAVVFIFWPGKFLNKLPSFVA